MGVPRAPVQPGDVGDSVATILAGSASAAADCAAASIASLANRSAYVFRARGTHS
ncbi:Uncharacterised protein [Mycobacterium tuberculosis]|uniref:Uncharacterized protein n=1 Tax=Mycobacterium tuberculosis TaxID=1773 RepID=A0A0U0T997_MYCTX|nr:Uncharacterised protein [Mycobacterium tuberculosis]